MADSNSKLPSVVSPSGGALITVQRAQRIATRMAEGVLARGSRQGRGLTSQSLYRIGDYEFRESDYLQIKRWARKLEKIPEEVVSGLSESVTVFDRDGSAVDSREGLQVKDGAIVFMSWDFERFPLTDWEWSEESKLESLEISNLLLDPVPTLPGGLRRFVCRENMLPLKVDLSVASALQHLECVGMDLFELDLSRTPALRHLDCAGNYHLFYLDLSGVPALRHLDCSGNEFMKLDLSAVPALRYLACGYNKLSHLDLSRVPALRYLECSSNRLMQLDLTHNPNLRKLVCDEHVELIGLPPELEVERV